MGWSDMGDDMAIRDEALVRRCWKVREGLEIWEITHLIMDKQLVVVGGLSLRDMITPVFQSRRGVWTGCGVQVLRRRSKAIEGDRRRAACGRAVGCEAVWGINPLHGPDGTRLAQSSKSEGTWSHLRGS